MREVLEETALHVMPISLVDTWNYVAETYQVTGIIYLCATENSDEIVLSEEHDQYEWFSPDVASLENMSWGFQSRMLKWDWDSLIAQAERGIT